MRDAPFLCPPDYLPDDPGPLPKEPVPMTSLAKYLPDRKVWAGGLSAIVSWLLVKLLHELVGLDLDPEAVSAFVGFVTAYVIPPTVMDVVKRVDNTIVKLAVADPTNPTTAVVVPTATVK